MEYVVGLGLQNPELKNLFQSDIRLLRYQMSKSGKATTLATTFFLFSSFLSKSSCQYGGLLYMHKTEDKSLWKKMSYGSDTWYMGRILEEQKTKNKQTKQNKNNKKQKQKQKQKQNACIALISICIII